MAQFAADVESQLWLSRVVATDGGILPHRIGAKFSGVDAEGDFALPSGENFAGESPARAASARFDLCDPEDSVTDVAEPIGVLDFGPLEYLTPVVTVLFKANPWALLCRWSGRS